MLRTTVALILLAPEATGQQYKECVPQARAKCQHFPCIDLREGDSHHHIMWRNPDGTATVDGEANNWRDSRVWHCTCWSGKRCLGLVGTWNCPGFYNRKIAITPSYGADFTSVRTNDYIEVCKPPDSLGGQTVSGIASYHQVDLRRGCPAKHAANVPLIKKTFATSAASTVVVHGNMIRNFAGRADLHLYVDNVRKDTSLTFSSSRQWEDASVVWMGRVPKGKHTTWVQSPQKDVWGCQGAWGEVDVLVVPSYSGVATYTVPERLGRMQQCPPPSKANSRLVQKTFTLKTDSVVMVHSSLIRLKNGRADLFLYVDGRSSDVTLTFTGSKQWDDATVYWQGLLKRGTHTVWVQSNIANVWGCQWPHEMWGNLNVLVLPAMQGLQVRTVKDTRRGCPAKSKAGAPLVKTSFSLPTDSLVVVHGNMIRKMKGRADLTLMLDNKRIDLTLTYTSSVQWEDAAVFWSGKVTKGRHPAWLTSGRSNVW